MFSTGIPDPTQGGSGIFNELVCRELLEQGCSVKAYFRAGDSFVREHIDERHLEGLERIGLTVERIPESSRALTSRGFDLLLQDHHYDLCKSIVDRDRKKLERLDGIVSLDLGWALALDSVGVPHVAILGDFLHHRLGFGARLSARRHTWHPWLTYRSLLRARSELVERLGGYATGAGTLGSFSPVAAAELRDLGLPCKHFRWFAPGPAHVPDASPPGNPFVALHVGSLVTSAGGNMIRYWKEAVLPALANVGFDLQLRLVGQSGSAAQELGEFADLELVFTGHLPSVDEEASRADLYFAPMKYPVGVRTRIVSALAYGLPIVADRTASLGLPELIDDRDVAFTSNATDIVDAVRRIRNDDEYRTQLRHGARAAWETYYNPVRNLPELLRPLCLTAPR
ncbi:MAG: glycosyltransferase [Solirubrobacteraceae bacterium]